MLNGQGTGRQRQRVYAVLVAMIVIGAGGCVVRDKVQGMVNSTDRDNFVSSGNSFIKAQNTFAGITNDPAAGVDLSKLAATTQSSLDAMKHSSAQMGALADKVTGSAHAIATTMWQASTGCISAAERLILGAAAHDFDAFTAAQKDNVNSADEFNNAIRTWKAL